MRGVDGLVSSGGSDCGTGGGEASLSGVANWVCLGGGLIAGFGGSAGLGLLSELTSGVPTGVLVDCGGDNTKDAGDWTTGDICLLLAPIVWGSTGWTLIEDV